MDDLSNNIYAYYRRHFDEMPRDKQLHFASRIFLWDSDSFGKEKLASLRSYVTDYGRPELALQTVYAEAKRTVYDGSQNSLKHRLQYFEKYPWVRPVSSTLFRLTFLDTIYGIDTRRTFSKLFPPDTLKTQFDRLLADPEALAMLSTQAINCLYLYNRVVLRDANHFSPELFLAVGENVYDLDDPIQLQLYIYLYTHCIIGESRFYARRLPDRHKDIYRRMLAELEIVISDRFTQINLDNKFEFLVCCQLVGFQSQLVDRVETEAVHSVSKDGIYLVDTLNSNPQSANLSFDLSEHRNVLYILSHRPSPLQAV